MRLYDAILIEPRAAGEWALSSPFHGYTTNTYFTLAKSSSPTEVGGTVIPDRLLDIDTVSNTLTLLQKIRNTTSNKPQDTSGVGGFAQLKDLTFTIVGDEETAEQLFGCRVTLQRFGAAVSFVGIIASSEPADDTIAIRCTGAFSFLPRMLDGSLLGGGAAKYIKLEQKETDAGKGNLVVPKEYIGYVDGYYVKDSEKLAFYKIISRSQTSAEGEINFSTPSITPIRSVTSLANGKLAFEDYAIVRLYGEFVQLGMYVSPAGQYHTGVHFDAVYKGSDMFGSYIDCRTAYVATVPSWLSLLTGVTHQTSGQPFVVTSSYIIDNILAFEVLPYSAGVDSGTLASRFGDLTGVVSVWANVVGYGGALDLPAKTVEVTYTNGVKKTGKIQYVENYYADGIYRSRVKLDITHDGITTLDFTQSDVNYNRVNFNVVLGSANRLARLPVYGTASITTAPYIEGSINLTTVAGSPTVPNNIDFMLFDYPFPKVTADAYAYFTPAWVHGNLTAVGSVGLCITPEIGATVMPQTKEFCGTRLRTLEQAVVDVADPVSDIRSQVGLVWRGSSMGATTVFATTTISLTGVWHSSAFLSPNIKWYPTLRPVSCDDWFNTNIGLRLESRNADTATVGTPMVAMVCDGNIEDLEVYARLTPTFVFTNTTPLALTIINRPIAVVETGYAGLIFLLDNGEIRHVSYSAGTMWQTSGAGGAGYSLLTYVPAMGNVVAEKLSGEIEWWQHPYTPSAANGIPQVGGGVNRGGMIQYAGEYIGVVGDYLYRCTDETVRVYKVNDCLGNGSNPVAVIKHILLAYCNLAETDLALASFDTAEAQRLEFIVDWKLTGEMSAATAIDTIAKEHGLFVFEQRTGLIGIVALGLTIAASYELGEDKLILTNGRKKVKQKALALDYFITGMTVAYTDGNGKAQVLEETDLVSCTSYFAAAKKLLRGRDQKAKLSLQTVTDRKTAELCANVKMLYHYAPAYETTYTLRADEVVDVGMAVVTDKGDGIVTGYNANQVTVYLNPRNAIKEWQEALAGKEYQESLTGTEIEEIL